MVCLRMRHYRRFRLLKKGVLKRFEKIEELSEIDEQGQKVQGQDIASSVHARPRMTYTKFHLHIW